MTFFLSNNVEKCSSNCLVESIAARLTFLCSLITAYSYDADHDSDLMAITNPSDADRRRSVATLSYSYHL